VKILAGHTLPQAGDVAAAAGRSGDHVAFVTQEALGFAASAIDSQEKCHEFAYLYHSSSLPGLTFANNRLTFAG
jgi:hypothetical protein